LSNVNVPTTFASRSRALTPQATLTAQNSAAKDRRKSLFRDKIRKHRDDARFEGRGDQVLRMDFVRERREWEDRLARRAPADLDGDENMEGIDEVGVKERGVVPMTEEEEIEALAQYLVDTEDDEMQLQDEREGDRRWEEHGQRKLLGRGNEPRLDGNLSYGSDDEDYDHLFMEVITGSLEQAGHAEESAQQQQGDTDYVRDELGNQHSSIMDLS
jgi:hypothetical protein